MTKEITSSKDNPLRDGVEAYNNGQLDRAKTFFEKVILNRQESRFLMEAQWMLGQTYERQGKWERAIVEYQSLIRNFPRNPHFEDGWDRISLLREILREKDDEKSFPILLGREATFQSDPKLLMKKYHAMRVNTIVLNTEMSESQSVLESMRPFISGAQRMGFRVFSRVNFDPMELFQPNVQNDLKFHLINLAVSGMDGILFDGSGISPRAEFNKNVVSQFLNESSLDIQPENIGEDTNVYWQWIGWRSREVMRILSESVRPVLNTRTHFYWGVIFPSQSIIDPHKSIIRTGLDLLEAKNQGVNYFGIRQSDNNVDPVLWEKIKRVVDDPSRIVMVSYLRDDYKGSLFPRSTVHGILYLDRNLSRSHVLTKDNP